MRYRKREELKDTDIEWVATIPKCWDSTKLKFQNHINMGQSPPSDGYNKKGIGIAFLQGNADFTDKHPQTDSFTDNGNKFCANEDILFSVRAPVGEINIANKEYCIGRGLCSISPRDVDSRFLWHYLHIARKELKSMSTGSTFESVSSEDVKNLSLILPPKSEQCAIAAFLDRKTKAIDALIQKKEQLIERLTEKRQALITQAVTKGLNSDASMEDSGIEWLGEIPEHWEVTKVKWLVSKIGSGKTPRGGSEVYKEKGIPFLRSQNIHFDGLRLDDVVYIDSETHKDMSSTAIKPNDVLLNITGASIGRASIVPKDFPRANLNQHVCILRPRKESVSPDFLDLVVSSDLIQNQIFAFENGTSREGLNFSQVGSLLVSLPQLEEQKNIVRKVREYEDQIFSLTKDIEKQIEKLKEYRQSLISAAVTGKIDVREEDPADFAECADKEV